jgi:two-component system chemotaxis response regulator CheB
MKAPPPVVALVCSAGGLEALITILSALPEHLPATVVVLQHHRPHEPTRLPWLLGARCALPVSVAHDGAALLPGEVIVVPSGTHALVTIDNRVALIASDGTPPYRPSADLLLTSLAIVAGPRTIAVILSGTGKDGATGATAIHDFGGTVIAADEASSTYFAMPQAAIARDEIVDYVLPVDEIGPFVVKLLGAGETA